ncbi:hypothetical protein C8R46DRAFT_1004638 [Mycena filopes]|nr:hypothetical protein C8R46DRAFT_1004638 [Mycena filopes]
MGSRKRDKELASLTALVQKKDTEITELRATLETHIAHALATKSRLLSALDTVDALRTDHGAELAANFEANKSLKEKVARYLNKVRRAELERDQLRDVVLELSDKIERSNGDITSWAYSRLKISRLLAATDPQKSNSDSASDLWAYASATISHLRNALTAECRAHALTRAAARARITALEAQLARRDVEVESCVMHAGQAFPPESRASHYPEIPPSPLPLSEMRESIKHTAAGNLVLEEEVRRLALQLQDAGLGLDDAELRDAPPSTSAPPLPRSTGPRPDPRHPKRDKQRDSGAHSRTHPRTTAAEKRRPPTPASAPETFDPDRTLRPVGQRTRSVPGGSPARLIAELGARIEGFHLEKELLSAQVRELQNERQSPSANAEPDTRTPEPRSQASSGEPSTVRQTRPQQPHVLLVDFDHDGEMSMDLATPLVPTLMLPLAGPSTLPPLAGPSTLPPLAGPSTLPPPLPSTEISPLDLSSDHPLPELSNGPSPDITDTSLDLGEQAVQELMDRLSAAAARRRDPP